MTTWTHDDLQTDLANHLHAGGTRMVWTNIVMGTAGAPRPDVLTLDPISWSNIGFLAYEVKISVSDFRSDVTSGKWQRYLEFAQGVVFACPLGMIGIADVPKEAGLIHRDAATWRMRKRPTLGKWHLDQIQMMKLAREPRHRPTVPMTENADTERWRNERLNRVEARIQRETIAKVGARLGKHVAQYLQDVAHAETVVGRARKEAEDILKKATEQREADDVELNAAYELLAQTLGIDGSLSHWTIRNEVRKAAARLTKDGEVEHLRAQLRMIGAAVEKAKALKPPKEPKRTDAA